MSITITPTFKNYLLLIGLIFAISPDLLSQGLFSRSNPTVATLQDERIKLNDLKNFYSRNYPQEEISTQKLRDFLDVYALYRAKIKEAHDLGLHQNQEFLDEISSFEKSAALAYWIENDIKEDLLEEFIERSQIEYLVSHVLIRLSPDAEPADTLSAYQKLLEAREEFLSGASMDTLNQLYSTRIQGNPIGGDIPWFTAGVTVYDFENAVYSMEPGQLSMPIRSQFGYHIIYVKEKRERTAGRFVSHIFFRGGMNSETGVDSAIAKLSAGAEWDEVVNQYSQDRQSALNGGSLGLIGNNLRFPQDFTSIILDLDPNQKWSGPIETQYGVHIFKIDSLENTDLTTDRIAELENQLRQLPRYKLDKSNVIERIRNSDFYKEYLSSTEVIDKVSLTLSSEMEDSNWSQSYTKKTKDEQFLVINDKPILISDALNWMSSNLPDIDIDELSVSHIRSYTDYLIEESIGEITAGLFPEFAETRQHFYNGLLVFKINEMNIWDPESVDSARIREYFELNIDQYIASADSIEESDSLNQDIELDPDQLFTQNFFRVFSDMQPIIEEEFNQKLFKKYQIKLYPRRIR